MEHVSTLEKYGPVGTIAVIFAVVIIVLWNEYKKQRDRAEKMAAERQEAQDARDLDRATFGKERVELRAEYERKFREMLDTQLKELRDERERNRSHEDAIRKDFFGYNTEARREFVVLMEKISDEVAKGNEEYVAIFQKFYDRFVGPSARGRY